jgi:hypothetical protein
MDKERPQPVKAGAGMAKVVRNDNWMSCKSEKDARFAAKGIQVHAVEALMTRACKKSIECVCCQIKAVKPGNSN